MDEHTGLQRFYAGFAGRYDLFMPWDRRIKRERRFFKYLLDSNDAATILDCFCGTGFHVSMLSEMGYEAEGIDISPEMIEMAKKNLKGRGFEQRVRVGDAKALDGDRKYDCVLSMGNSLPHEFGDENVLKVLGNMYRVLSPGGFGIIHMENFDRLYEDRERFIPSVFRRDAGGTDVFIFAIDYYEEKVVFNILSVIERHGTPGFAADTVEYNPIGIGHLEELLETAGFHDLRLYEDFRMTPLGTDGTYDVVAVVKK